ncbi:MAG: hypothetical protein QXD48_03520 [Candidatus Aenigmatarchaeota archaeon]
MKKKFLILLLIVFCFLDIVLAEKTETQLILSSSSGFSQSEQNHKKVCFYNWTGFKELTKRETVLVQKKIEIETYFQNMGNDGIISFDELKTLKGKVKEFDKIRARYDKELGIYKITMRIEILPIIRRHLEIYFECSEKDGDTDDYPIPCGYYRDNDQEEIKHYFEGITGREIKVERADNEKEFLLTALLGAIALILLFIGGLVALGAGYSIFSGP